MDLQWDHMTEKILHLFQSEQRGSQRPIFASFANYSHVLACWINCGNTAQTPGPSSSKTKSRFLFLAVQSSFRVERKPRFPICYPEVHLPMRSLCWSPRYRSQQSEVPFYVMLHILAKLDIVTPSAWVSTMWKTSGKQHAQDAEIKTIRKRAKCPNCNGCSTSSLLFVLYSFCNIWFLEREDSDCCRM